MMHKNTCTPLSSDVYTSEDSGVHVFLAVLEFSADFLAEITGLPLQSQPLSRKPLSW